MAILDYPRRTLSMLNIRKFLAKTNLTPFHRKQSDKEADKPVKKKKTEILKKERKSRRLDKKIRSPYSV